MGRKKGRGWEGEREGVREGEERGRGERERERERERDVMKSRLKVVLLTRTKNKFLKRIRIVVSSLVHSK